MDRLSGDENSAEEPDQSDQCQHHDNPELPVHVSIVSGRFVVHQMSLFFDIMPIDAYELAMLEDQMIAFADLI